MRSAKSKAAAAASVSAVVLCLLASVADAKRAHKANAAGAAARGGRPATISGTVVVQEAATAASRGGQPGKKQLDWSVEIEKDVVMWDELEKDGVKIESCSNTEVVLAGSELDASDYYKGGVFVIDAEDWENSCGSPTIAAGVPEEDDCLFYRIDAVKAEDDSVTLSIAMVDGATVAPVVNLGVGEDGGAAPAPATENVGFVEVTGGTSTASRQLMVGEKDLSLPFASRVSFNKELNSKATLFTGAELTFGAKVAASIGKFKLVRLRGLQFSWEQRFEASVEAELDAAVAFAGDTGGELLKVAIPNFGFSAKIPFIGRASAGAFVQLDWVADVEFNTKLNAQFQAKHQVHQVANAKLRPAGLTTRDLIPKNDQTSTGGSLDFGAQAEASLVGFVGVRPGLSLEVTLKSKGVGGNAGFSVGLQAAARINSVAFPPVTSGLRIGKCDQCHKLEGDFAIKGKDLGIQLTLGSTEKEIILVDNLFEKKIAVFCGLAATCPADGQGGQISPVGPVTVKPPKKADPNKNRCKSCKKDSDCGSGLRCKESGRRRLIRRRRKFKCMAPSAGRNSC